MISLMFLIGVLGLLFIMAFATRRRFGILGLALAAGALLSANWSGTLTPFIQQQGVTLISPPLQVIVEVVLTLLPAAVLLLHGPTYTKLWQRVLGAAGFALLSYALLEKTLGLIMQLDEPGLSVYTFLSGYTNLIIVVGIIAAVVDTFLAGHRKKREH